jgi:hypothetical protein
MASVHGFDSYIRVSRVGEREGDSYQTVEEQRRSIADTALRKGVPLSGFEVVEEDVSGKIAAKDRRQEEILKRIETGQSRGLIVAYQDRLSRGSLMEQAAIWERLEKAGARFLTGDGLDSADEGQELLFTVRAAIARDQWKRKQKDWQKSKRNAIERGIHFAARVPTGYIREKGSGQPLEVDPKMAEVIVGVFERRAKGWNRGRIARWMNEQDATNGTATHETVRSIIKNPTYLGEARSGEFVKRNAHPAIVSQKLWDEANSVTGSGTPGTGKVANTLLALGIARCRNCGHRLQVNMSGSTKRFPSYACKFFHCKERGYVKAAELDAYIQTWILTIPTEASVIHTEARSDVADARKWLGEAEYDKKKFVGNRELRRLLSDEEYATELEALVESVTEAQIALDMAQRSEQDAKTVTALDLWNEWDIETKREYLNKVISSLTVGQSKRGRVPLYDRVKVDFAVPMERPPRLLNEVT